MWPLSSFPGDVSLTSSSLSKPRNVLRYRSSFDFASVCMSTVVWNTTACRDWSNHHHNQEIQQFLHHNPWTDWQEGHPSPQPHPWQPLILSHCEVGHFEDVLNVEKSSIEAFAIDSLSPSTIPLWSIPGVFEECVPSYCCIVSKVRVCHSLLSMHMLQNIRLAFSFQYYP